MNVLPEYEVYAIRYAEMPRRRRDNFISGDPHDSAMPMDFFVWLIRSPERIVLIDTGFNSATARTRDRKLLRCPIDALRVLGVSASQIEDVVLTHLHYDHAGNLPKLPAAKFHVQDSELAFATGRCMCHASIRHTYSVDDVTELVRKVYADRVVFHDGDETLAPGIELMLIGGHTRGLQAVRVHTARGWVVVASDASHYYENLHAGRAFPLVDSVPTMLEGHRRLLGAADSAEHVIPGHDPLVRQNYPAVPGDEIGISCLHLPPTR
ncbi:MAG: N-acyl homoserine lactonase family protein [Burkholderiaceae bacterium]|nr:N-acyl homoserine lactonase family protein [Burkholderiaceae bacterium]